MVLCFNHCTNEDITTEAHGTKTKEKKVIHRNLSDLAKDLDNLTLTTKQDQDELFVTHTTHKLRFETL